MDGNAQEFSTHAEELVDKYAKLVYQLAYARTRSREAAEDIFQDVFLRLVSKRPVFDSEEHEKAWFCRVTVNCANSYWRNPFRRRTQPLDETRAGELAAPAPRRAAGRWTPAWTGFPHSCAPWSISTTTRAIPARRLPPCWARGSPPCGWPSCGPGSSCGILGKKEGIPVFEHEYQSRFDAVAPSPELVADTKIRLRAALAGKQRPRRHLTRRGLAALAAAAVLTVSALAAAPAVWQTIQKDLGNRAPYAAQVLGCCEDQGVRIEVQAALADTRVTRLYFTVQDLTGNTLDADTTSDLTLSLETNGRFDRGNGGKGLEVLSYDPEQRLATLVYSLGTAELAGSPPTQVRLEASCFIPGHRQARLALNQEELPAQTLESSVTDTGVTVLQPDQNHMALEKDGAVSISSMGFAADGRYHVRFVQEGTIFPLMDNGSPCYVEYYLYDPENPDRWPQQDVGDVICTDVQDGWDVCLPSLTPDTLKYLELVQLRTDYAAGGGRLEGNWKITVPVEVMALRAATPATTLVFPYTHGGEMPFGHDWDARLKQLTVSPLSVCADFITPEGQEYPCQLTGTELSLTVTLADGSVLTPAYYDEVWSQRTGWVMWEFEAPIQPEQVRSVTLNGQSVPFP